MMYEKITIKLKNEKKNIAFNIYSIILIVIITPVARKIILAEYDYDLFFFIISIGVIYAISKKIVIEDAKRENFPKDNLARNFYADRIEDFIRSGTDSNQTINNKKITLLAEWGAGKTYMLKLLFEKLSNPYNRRKIDNQNINLNFYKGAFSTAWVNPWSAKTPEEAWNIIIEGITYAFNNGKLSFHESYSFSPIGAITKKILQISNGISGLLSEYFHGINSNFSTNTINNLNDKLLKIKKPIVIFIDDMERAQPNIIKTILPILDKASELKNIVFLAAIDSNQIELALATSEVSNDNKKSASGYIDKVFPFQLQLPLLDDLTKKRYIEYYLAKYYSLATNLIEYGKIHFKIFPNNARKLKKALDDLSMCEIIFLNRSKLRSSNEFFAFFTIKLLEILNPNMFNEWKEILHDINKKEKLRSFFNSSDLLLFDEVIENKKIDIPKLPITDNAFKNKDLFTIYCIKHGLLADASYNNINVFSTVIFTLNYEYTKRISLNDYEISEITKKLKTENYTKSIPSIINTEFEDSAPLDLELSYYEIANNLFKTNITSKHIQSLLKQESKSGTPFKIDDKYLKSWLIGTNFFDKENISDELIAQWETLISFIELTNLSEILWEPYGKTWYFLNNRMHGNKARVKTSSLSFDFLYTNFINSSDLPNCAYNGEDFFLTESFLNKSEILGKSLYNQYLTQFIPYYNRNDFIEIASKKSLINNFIPHTLYSISNINLNNILKNNNFSENFTKNVVIHLNYFANNIFKQDITISELLYTISVVSLFKDLINYKTNNNEDNELIKLQNTISKLTMIPVHNLMDIETVKKPVEKTVEELNSECILWLKQNNQ